MRLLLDSHAALAAATRPQRLSAKARSAVEDPANDVFLSVVSPYELELKKALGKLAYPQVDWAVFAAKSRLSILPISLDHGLASARLPLHHRDPWDRLLVAQASVDTMVLVTSDARIAAYGVPTLW